MDHAFVFMHAFERRFGHSITVPVLNKIWPQDQKQKCKLSIFDEDDSKIVILIIQKTIKCGVRIGNRKPEFPTVPVLDVQ